MLVHYLSNNFSSWVTLHLGMVEDEALMVHDVQENKYTLFKAELLTS